MRVDGGCHCGKITYEADIDPDKAGLCHCTDCQTLTSSAGAAPPWVNGLSSIAQHAKQPM
jgi:hypothetical protein